MKVRANRCDKTVEQRFRRRLDKRAQPSKTIKKPTQTGITLLSCYFFELAEKFQMVFKELIYTLSKAVSSINVTEFSEGGRDSTKKDDLKGFKESAEVYGSIFSTSAQNIQMQRQQLFYSLLALSLSSFTIAWFIKNERQKALFSMFWLPCWVFA